MQLAQLLFCSGPSPSLVYIRVHHQRRVRQGVDDLIAPHGVTRVESCVWVVGRDQGEPSVQQQISMLAIHDGSFQAVGQDASDFAARLQRGAHGRLVNASGSAGDDSPSRLCRKPPNRIGIFDQRVAHVA